MPYVDTFDLISQPLNSLSIGDLHGYRSCSGPWCVYTIWHSQLQEWEQSTRHREPRERSRDLHMASESRGTNSITAGHNGDILFNGSTSAGLSQVVN